MGLKFRRRQKLFPEVYLNFSSKGISTTIGVKALGLNLIQLNDSDINNIEDARQKYLRQHEISVSLD
jgi:hypothetical protein